MGEPRPCPRSGGSRSASHIRRPVCARYSSCRPLRQRSQASPRRRHPQGEAGARAKTPAEAARDEAQCTSGASSEAPFASSRTTGRSQLVRPLRRASRTSRAPTSSNGSTGEKSAPAPQSHPGPGGAAARDAVAKCGDLRRLRHLLRRGGRGRRCESGCARRPGTASTSGCSRWVDGRELFGHGPYRPRPGGRRPGRYFVRSGRDWSPWSCRWAAYLASERPTNSRKLRKHNAGRGYRRPRPSGRYPGQRVGTGGSAIAFGPLTRPPRTPAAMATAPTTSAS